MKFWTLALSTVAAISIGCSRPATSVSEKETSPEATAVSQATEKTAEEVGLQILDWDAALALAKGHPGKVVVVDVWATYCPPCIEEFPHLVKLQNEHRNSVACISVSADFDGTGDTTPETHREKVHQFLKTQKANFQNVLLSTDTESLFGKKTQQQSIPFVMVFNQKGELAAEFPDLQNPDEFTYEKDIIPLVKKLVEAK